MITTTLETRGAKAAARKREWACSTPALTTASPYSQICGTNMISSAATVTALPSHVGLANAVPYRGAAKQRSQPRPESR